MITITTQVWTEAEQESGKNSTVFSSIGEGKPDNQIEELVLNRLHDAIEVTLELAEGFVTGKADKKTYSDAILFFAVMTNMVFTTYNVKPDDFLIAVLERYEEIDSIANMVFDATSEEQMKAALIKTVSLAARMANDRSE